MHGIMPRPTAQEFMTPSCHGDHVYSVGEAFCCGIGGSAQTGHRLLCGLKLKTEMEVRGQEGSGALDFPFMAKWADCFGSSFFLCFWSWEEGGVFLVCRNLTFGKRCVCLNLIALISHYIAFNLGTLDFLSFFFFKYFWIFIVFSFSKEECVVSFKVINRNNLRFMFLNSHVCYNDNILKLEDIIETVTQNIPCPQDCVTLLV